jgi:purine-cytosine permease-like protein
LVDFPDLSGPILISLCLGFLLLLGGKIHFSDILTYFILGNVVLYVLFMFMGKVINELSRELTLPSTPL